MWLLTIILALGTLPLAYWISLLLMAIFPALDSLLESAYVPGILEDVLKFFGIAVSAAGVALTSIGWLVLPLAVILTTSTTYSRQLKSVTNDLVYGSSALLLVDDQYSMIHDEERRHHMQPLFMRTDLGNTFLARVGYFATYYRQIQHLAYYGTEKLKIPMTFDRNCWLDGTFSCLTGCLNSCIGAGIIFTIPLFFRLAVSWPRIVATKQACADYLLGRFDYLLEQPEGTDHTTGNPG